MTTIHSTSGAEISYPFAAPEFAPFFKMYKWGSCC